MDITLHRDGDHARFTLSGRLDALAAGQVRERISVVMDEGARRLELDVAAVDYISSAGIRVLQEGALRLARIKGSFRITSASEFVRDMLEIVGLYDLLAPAETIPAVFSEQIAIPANNLHGELIRLDPSALLRMEAAGPDGLMRPFPATTFSIGFGVLGTDGKPTAEQCGAVLSAGGYAAFSCPAEQYVPDYMIYATEFVPQLYLLDGLRWSGDFAIFLDFSTEGDGGIDFGLLCRRLLDFGGAERIGVVLVGEAADVVGAICAPHPEADGHGRDPRVHGEAALLAAGWVVSPGAGHFHAVVFRHAPLRKGFQKLPDAVTALFELPLVDVLQLSSATRLRRGAVWLAPVDPDAVPLPAS